MSSFHNQDWACQVALVFPKYCVSSRNSCCSLNPTKSVLWRQCLLSSDIHPYIWCPFQTLIAWCSRRFFMIWVFHMHWRSRWQWRVCDYWEGALRKSGRPLDFICPLRELKIIHLMSGFPLHFSKGVNEEGVLLYGSAIGTTGRSLG